MDWSTGLKPHRQCVKVGPERRKVWCQFSTCGRAALRKMLAGFSLQMLKMMFNGTKH